MKIVKLWKTINNKFNFFSCFTFLYFCIFLPATIALSMASKFIPTRPFSLALIAMLLLLLLLSLPTILKMINYRDLIFIAFFILCVVMVFVRQNVDSTFIDGMKTIITSCLFFFIGFRFSNYRKNYLFIVIGYFVLALLLFINALIFKKSGLDEDMTKSYLSSFSAAVILAYSLIVCKNKFLILLGIGFSGISLAASIFFGSRGPTIFFIVFAVALLYYKLFWKNKNRLTIGIVIVVLSIAIFVTFMIVAKTLYNNGTIAKDHFLYKLYLLLFDTTGRNNLFKLVLNGTSYSAPFGNGLFGDRLLTRLFYFSNPSTYSHNIFLEMFASFGWFGSFLLFLFLLLYIIDYSSNIYLDKKKASLLLPLSCVGVLSLFVSNSFIVSDYFWGFCGICLSILADRKQVNAIQVQENQQ